MSSLVQNTHLVQSLDYCNSCFSGVDETCGFGKILAVGVCESSLGFVSWVSFQEGWVGKFRESADKSYKSLLCSVFDSVSGSDFPEVVRQESSTEDESLSIGPVFVFLDKQGYNTLKSIGAVDNIGDKALISVNGSACDFNCTYWEKYLFCRATHWYFNYSREGWCVILLRVCRGVDWVVVF